MTIFQPVNIRFTSSIVSFGAIYLLYKIYKFGLLWLKFNPNEKWVTINKDILVLTYPNPKKDIEIPFADIEKVIFNMLTEKNEAVILTKTTDQDLINIGIDHESHTVNSLSQENWIVVVNEFNIQLLLNYELDIAENKDIYILQKGGDENEKISKTELQEIMSKRTNIKLLGIQKIFNSSESVKIEPMECYTIATQFGMESFDFVDGKIAVSYTKGKTPNEIVELAQSANWVCNKL